MNDESPLDSDRDDAQAVLAAVTETIEAEADGGSAPMRHLGIAALNLATEADPNTLITAGRALPWVAIYLKWKDGTTSLQDLVDLIGRHELVRHLGERTLLRRLSRAVDAQPSAIRRSPELADATAAADLRSQILVGIVDHDLRIHAISGLPAHRRRDALLEDVGLLATALEICGEQQETDTGTALRETLPDWPLRKPCPALEVLARFEQTDFEEMPVEFDRLGHRAQSFEQSLARHLHRHSLLYAIRAALAFSPPQGQPLPSERRLRRFLTGFSAFADDSTLLELTIALMTVRHRAIEHLRGALPLDALNPWITYLRGPCADFAEERGVTLREATNFAHYAFHLLNICDLVREPDAPLHDPLRRALMDVENELKEFALVGQRQGLTDQQSDLHRYERTRWRNDGPRALLADRLARLCGGFRAGHRSGPPGSPPRPNDDIYEDCLELLGLPPTDQEQERVDDEDAGNGYEDPELDATAHLIQHAHLRGHRFLNGWTPQDALSLLITTLANARRSSSIDVDESFIIDFSPLEKWLSGEARHRRATIVLTLLRLQDHTELADEILIDRDAGLAAETEIQELVIEFRVTSEVEALLTLLADTDDDSFAATLVKQLEFHLHSSQTHTDEKSDQAGPNADDESRLNNGESSPRR